MQFGLCSLCRVKPGRAGYPFFFLVLFAFLKAIKFSTYILHVWYRFYAMYDILYMHIIINVLSNMV